MKVSTQREPAQGGELVTFTGEDPISLKQVEGELSGLWRQASETLQSGDGTGLARACLWNLVAYHANPKRQPGHVTGEPERLERLLTEVTTSVPARVMHLEKWEARRAPRAGSEVQAWISSTCLLGEGGPQVVCCEEVHIAGYGEKGQSHFPALVRALLVPDLPVALLWLDDVPQKGQMLGQLLELSDRMVIDTQHTQEPASLLAVRELPAAAGVRVVDLAWLRLTPLRYLLAELFDAPKRAQQLQRVESVTIETNALGRNTGLLVLGWLLSRCGCSEVRALDGSGKARRWRWQARQDGRSVPITAVVIDTDGGVDGIFSLEVKAGRDTFTLRDVDPEHMTVIGPDRNLPSVRLREADDAGLVVEALGSGHPVDRVYAEALEMAAMLVEAEQQNP